MKNNMILTLIRSKRQLHQNSFLVAGELSIVTSQMTCRSRVCSYDE